MSEAPPPPAARSASPAPPARRAPAAASWLDGLLAGLAGALVLALGFAVADRLAGREGATFALLGTIALLGRGASRSGVWVGPREIGAGLVMLLVVACLIGLALAWWVARLRRFPSAGSAWLASFAGLALGLAAIDRATGAQLVQRLGPLSLLGAITPAAIAMPFVLWKRQPRLVQNRRDLWDDEP